MSEGEVLVGDLRDSLERVPDATYDMVVSSPPYYGSVRTYGALAWFASEAEAVAWAVATAADWNARYGTARVDYVAYPPTYVKRRKKKPWAAQVVPLSVWDGDGDVNCQHEWGDALPAHHVGQVPDKKNASAWVGNVARDGESETSIFQGREDKLEKNVAQNTATSGRFCQRCGAWKGQLGQEPTPALYLQHIEEIARLLKRKCKPWATVFWNIGDCYSGTGSGKGTGNYGDKDNPACVVGSAKRSADREDGEPLSIPHGTVEAFRRAELVWRSEIIWVKAIEARGVEDTLFGEEDVDLSRGSCMPAPMVGWRFERHKIKVAPAAVTYGEKAKHSPDMGVHDPSSHGQPSRQTKWADCPGCPRCAKRGGLILRKGRYRPVTAHEYIFLFAAGQEYYGDGEGVKALAKYAGSVAAQGSDGRANAGVNSRPAEATEYGNTRNLRDVWEIGAEPLKENHFAAFPSELPRRCIRIGTSDAGVCSKCGAPFARVITKEVVTTDGRRRPGRPDGDAHTATGHVRLGGAQGLAVDTLGWLPTCDCEAPARPAHVLDPFGGSGRTAEAAHSLGRACTLCEIVPAYAEMAERRLHGTRDMGSLFAVQEAR